jgi:hypothetical protein
MYNANKNFNLVFLLKPTNDLISASCIFSVEFFSIQYLQLGPSACSISELISENMHRAESLWDFLKER